MSVKIYCESCGSHQPLKIDWMRHDTVFPDQGIWGDLVCETCFLVLNSVTVEEEGIYELTKVDDLPPDEDVTVERGVRYKQ